ncbi:MAG TPA: 50S ribosomal protein L6 [Acidimicrobiales bacterium]|nr:50S ribosomal protein L6 [Acidimicrobiales bacterium]
MSRIGRSPITVPANVTVSVADGVVTVTGPNATMTRILPEGITLSQEGEVLSVDRASEETSQKALHGLTRTLVANMVTGVTTGWTKELEIIGVGYRAAAAGADAIDLALGFSHPVKFTAPAGVTFEVPTPTRVIVKGPDKEVVGQVAASIRKLRKPEPYKGKGVRYLGERVLRKAGKAAK